ncbi:MAG TPA: 6-carboxytetrahydropterin synthase QueD [Methanothermobacter sp.]|uniref:6-carboxy-5,6,7,8-tetrahydropterin synthase n=1 Tax=Methanothermobacter tenebrarum TaxID=680118 RepID=A0ABM7YBJ8_9EURY|nr:6-carboxytetrahydropterin synthase [Methanothermobacter tenebrarum]MDI6882344.1 6-carboxytetrahydropterin synthase [Methanothermobacter sp.]MDX9694124.1 6-carboxytetrahydropterin synthase [Methanothermobacter sp.]BDH78818.1 6-carboxy-5,6,7,8-tetrahydropterin synthase [Methanothermobacter tenebrarum]HHW17028.1 6-carboxytetrahydropterin synthase QueD [Methanothermobacter sp.]HOQ19818.1 6-carboxytetrahydropterin synthase [Methanothermobacter sp.]
MKIIIEGIHANLRFSAAHMIPEHETCGVIHGHSYIVDVEVEGEPTGKHGFIVDFKDVKGIMRRICKRLDHRLLVPLESPLMDLQVSDDKVEFQVAGKEYKIPKEDCCLLPIESTSAEGLAEYFARKLYEELKEYNKMIRNVKVCVNEGIGQGAIFTYPGVERI